MNHDALDTPSPIGARTHRRRAGWIVTVQVVAAVLVLGGVGVVAMKWGAPGASIKPADQYVVTPRTFKVVLREKGELKAAKSIDVINAVEGRSTIISLVPEGTPVQKGDLLVELASDEIENKIIQEGLKEANAKAAVEVAQKQLEIQLDKNASDIRKAELEVELKKLELDRYVNGEWTQAEKESDIAIDQAEILLKRRKDDFEAADSLFKRKFITKTEYEEDEFNYQKAQWDLDKARHAKNVLKEYTHRAELRRRESEHQEAVKELDRVAKNAQAEEFKARSDLEGKEKELKLIVDQLAKLMDQRQKCRILAPSAGFVVYFGAEGGGRFFNNDQQIREGASVHERQVLMTLPDTSEMMVVVRIHEAKTNKLSLGQEASITVEGLPGAVLSGKVTKIAALADTQNRWLNPDLKEYETEITIDKNEYPLKPGVTSHAEILVEVVEDRLAVPVQSVYTQAGRRYVFRANGATMEAVEIKVGAIGTEFAEIREGVSAGESVLLAFGDDQKRLIPESVPGERGGPRERGAPGERGPRQGRPGGGPGQRAASDKAETPASNPGTVADRSAMPAKESTAGKDIGGSTGQSKKDGETLAAKASAPTDTKAPTPAAPSDTATKATPAAGATTPSGGANGK